jgi:hypothetical protein
MRVRAGMQAAVHEGIALALISMRESHIAADKKGSLTSEELVASLSAVMCDFDSVLPFEAAADMAAGDAGAKLPGAEGKEARKVTVPKKGAKARILKSALSCDFVEQMGWGTDF